MNEPKGRRLSDVMLRNDFKFGVVIFLLTLAFVQYVEKPDVVRTLCLCGVVFSVVGDLFLMDYMGAPSIIFKGKQFYAGTASFVITHVFYRQMFNAANPESDVWGIGYFVTFIIMLALIVAFCKINPRNIPGWFYGVSGFYTGIILSDFASAINCALVLGGCYIWAAIGVACFLFSDILIFIRETKLDTPMIRKLIWVFYPLGQILIIMNV